MNEKSYHDVLTYFLPQYEKKQCKNIINFRFVSDDDVNLIGLYYYIPYNLHAVSKFKKFINK